jgi:dihydrodipicolinate synthase/N-acetylneuraminate lyase
MIDPWTMLVPRRKIAGISAILLPFDGSGRIDWSAFDAHVARTAAAGLTPAVNMDTGYVNLLDDATKCAVLERTRNVLGGQPFVAGAFVADAPGCKWNRDDYLQQIAPIQRHGGTPVIFPSYGLTSLPDDGVVAAHRELAADCDRFIGFELGQMFAPFGRIYPLETYRGLLGIPQCIGAKHSSLRRDLEWQRLHLRNELRPEFHVFTGNDLAIDMVMYGSDYLLGLSTFAPDLFAKRDQLWATGNPDFFELNDTLQYLGCFAFRNPVPAYKHSAAMFLKLRGWLSCDGTHPRSAVRPDSDREILRDIARRLQITAEG